MLLSGWVLDTKATPDNGNDLNDEIAGLVARIKGVSVGESARIALLLGHGRPALVGLCAALQSERRFVPLDPAWPDSRIEQVIDDASPELIIVDPLLAPRLAGQGGPPVLVTKGVPGSILTLPLLAGEPSGRAGYILYTSGSTGRPKGVVQTAASMVEHARTYAQSIELRRGQRLSWLAPLAADAGIMDIVAGMVTGATLCAYDPRDVTSSGFAAWLERSALSALHLTPTLLRAFFAGRTGPCITPGLTRLIFGGEAVTSADIERSWRLLPSIERIINGYGPTECTVACQWHIDRHTAASRQVPIGRPVAGIEVLLRDDAGDLTSGAGSGELIIRSSLVAVEYWLRPRETSAAFARDAESGVPLYATGDFARRDESGILHHLGRLDDQVKVAGTRVELGEVEAVLASAPGVDLAAASLCQECSRPHLRAWVVAADQERLEAQSLRAYLLGHLPVAMVPSSIAVVPSLPFTTTGKVDRQTLRREPCPAMEPAVPASADTILSIWRQVLGDAQVEADDDFFARGGDSLAAVQAMIALEAAFGGGIPSIFDYATPRAMRRALDDVGRPGESAPELAVDKPFPTPPQRRLLGRRQEREAFEIALLMDIEGPLEERSFRQAVTKAVAGYVEGCGQGEESDPWLSLPSTGDDTALIAQLRAEARRSEAAPVVRCHLSRRSIDKHCLALLLDHAWSDGWSRLLLEESIFANYASRPLKTTSAAAAAQRMNLRSRRFASVWAAWSAERCATFLAERFGSAAPPAPVLSLPSAAAGTGSISRRLRSMLPKGATALSAFARLNRTTPFAVFLASTMVALHKFTGLPRITVTTDRLNRFGPDSGAFGLFAEPFPLSADVAAAQTMSGLVLALHRRLGQAQDPAEPFFADLVDLVWPGWLARYDQLFPVAAFLSTDEGPRLRPGGLRTSTREIGTGATSRDLIVDAAISGGRLTIDLVWRRGRFEDGQMRDLLDVLVDSIGTLAGGPEEPLHRVVAAT